VEKGLNNDSDDNEESKLDLGDNSFNNDIAYISAIHPSQKPMDNENYSPFLNQDLSASYTITDENSNIANLNDDLLKVQFELDQIRQLLLV